MKERAEEIRRGVAAHRARQIAAGRVALLGLLVGWAWHVADEQRDRERERQLPQPREVLVRDAAGALIGNEVGKRNDQRY